MPVDESTMNTASPRNSICETLRAAYHMTGEPDVKLKLREATAMAKAMSAKLAEKHPKWYWNFWDLNPDGLRKRHELMLKPIDSLMISYDDFANTMYRFWMCAKHLGLNA